MDSKDNSMKNIFIISFFGTMMFLRILGIGEEWMGFIAIISFMVTLWNLYSECFRKYKNYPKFERIRGASIIGGVVLVILLAVLIFTRTSIPNRVTDSISFAALLISVPDSYYFYILDGYIKGEN